MLSYMYRIHEYIVFSAMPMIGMHQLISAILYLNTGIAISFLPCTEHQRWWWKFPVVWAGNISLFMRTDGNEDNQIKMAN